MRKMKLLNDYVYLISIILCFFNILLFAQSTTDSTLANQYFAKAKKFSENAQFDSSTTYFQKALELYQEIANQSKSQLIWEQYIECQNNIGYNALRQGKYDHALEIYKEALETGLAQLSPQKVIIGETYRSIGKALHKLGRYNDALAYYNKVLDMRFLPTAATNHLLAETYSSMGSTYYRTGEYDTALMYYQKALETKRQSGVEKEKTVAAILSNISIAYWGMGDYYQALDYNSQSLLILQQILPEHHPNLATGYENAGIFHKNLGNFDQAIEFQLRALEIRKSNFGEIHPEVADAYYNIGVLYERMEQIDTALGYYQKALDISLKTLGEDHPFVADSYRTIGVVHEMRGEPDKALFFLEKTVNILTGIFGESHPSITTTYLHIGQVYTQKNNFHHALQYYQQALFCFTKDFEDLSFYENPQLSSVSSHRKSINVLLAKAAALEKLADQKTASDKERVLKASLSTIDLTMQVLNRMRHSFDSEEARLYLGDFATEIYETGIRVALKLHEYTEEIYYTERAYEFIENSKFAVLQLTLQDSHAKEFAGIPDSLLAAERKIKADLTTFETRLQRQIAKTPKRQNSTRINELERQIFELKSVHGDLVKKLEDNYPQYYDLKYQSEQISIEEIQQQLPPKSIILNFLMGKKSLYFAAISHNKFEIKTIPIDSTFSALSSRFTKSLKFIDPATYLADATALYQLIFSPVETLIKAHQHLVIIPDGTLYYIPFEALIQSAHTDLEQSLSAVDFRSLNYLIKDYEISYHYSTALFLKNTSSKIDNSNGAFLGFAPVFKDANTSLISQYQSSIADFITTLFNYRSVTVDGKHYNELTFSEVEIRKIAEMFEANHLSHQQFFHEAASEDAFKSSAPVYNILHIATHGILNKKKPALSGLIFAQPSDASESEDGILYVAETYNLSLNADLLVLSSCESGVGEYIKGEGVMALTRGFLYAGAKNIVHSLWKVADETTSRLMIEFYRQILVGESYSVALRQAKLRLIADPETAFPVSWSSFVLLGK